MLAPSGRMDRDSSGYAGIYRLAGEHINPGDEAIYDIQSGDAISLYGTGGEAPPPVGKRGWWSK